MTTTAATRIVADSAQADPGLAGHLQLVALGTAP
jgi:hypothetical protein